MKEYDDGLRGFRWSFMTIQARKFGTPEKEYKQLRTERLFLTNNLRRKELLDDDEVRI